MEFRIWKRIIGVIAIIGALAVLYFVWPFVMIIFGVFFGMAHIRSEEARLRSPKIYQPVAKRLALYCQSDTNLIPQYISAAWFPPEMSEFGHAHGGVQTNMAWIELGGGFYHYGYALYLDTFRSTPKTNVWQLVQRGENKADIKLTKVELAAADHLSADELYKLVGTGFDKNIGGSDGFKGKILLSLRFGGTNQAAELCRQWIKAEPDTWLPRFTYAHIRSRLNEYPAASAEFAEWVKSHKNFSRCVYLAVFSFREGNTNDTLQAVRLCLDQPLVDAQDQDRNNASLGYHAGLLAFTAGDYDLALDICKKLEPFALKTEPFFIRDFALLKAASFAMKKNMASAKEAMKVATEHVRSDLFSAASQRKTNAAMQHAIDNGDLAFLREPRNWVDENETWYSPFEIDETGIHNAKVVNPYPRTWTNDVIRPFGSL